MRAIWSGFWPLLPLLVVFVVLVAIGTEMVEARLGALEVWAGVMSALVGGLIARERTR